MFDSTDNPNDQRLTVEEGYSSSVTASNLRVEADRRTPADMVIAAGMSQHSLGMALLRLHSEWDRSAKPKPMEAGAIEQLARSLEVEGPTRRVAVPMTSEQIQLASAEAELTPDKQKEITWAATITVPNSHKGLVRIEEDAKVKYQLPLVVAKRQAAQWHEHELGLLLQSLKSLPGVRTALVHWARQQGFEDGVHLVVPVLLWWLDPKCPTCKGVGLRVIANTGGRSSGKPCKDCRGHQVTGEKNVPHGWRGRRMVTHLNDCLKNARKDLDAKFRHQRGRS